MAKLTLTDLANLQNENTAVSAVNANNAAIETALENTLSRDGTSPNPMGATLDMDSHQIINLPQPATANSPLRFQDLDDFVGGGTVTNIPPGGANHAVLEKTSTSDYLVNWTTTPTFTNLTLGPQTGVGYSLGSTQVLTGTATTNQFFSNVLNIASDNADFTGANQSLNIGLWLPYKVGGATAKGSRAVTFADFTLTSPTGNVGGTGAYIASSALVTIASGDNGTALTPLGASGNFYALNTGVQTTSSTAKFLGSVISAEFDIGMIAGSSAYIKNAIRITQYPFDVVQGSPEDAGISFGNNPGAIGWQNGILFTGGANFLNPSMNSNGTILKCQVDPGGTAWEVTNGIDLSLITISGNAFLSPGYTVSGLGVLATNHTGTNTFVTTNQNPLTLKTNGANNTIAVVDCATAGKQSLWSFADSTTVKWYIGKQTDNSFIISDDIVSVLQVAASSAGTRGIKVGATVTGSYQGLDTINAVGLYVQGVTVSTAVGANPSASVGLTAVNGSAVTWMRSDGAPALSQSITPTWTNPHIFTNTSQTPVTIKTTGANQTIPLVDCGTAGKQSLWSFADATVVKWYIGKESDNSFIISNGAVNVMQAAPTSAGTQGIIVGTAVTGGYKGINTINAVGLYIGGVAVTAAGITALTGDVTATGPGSAAATLATVASAGTTGSSTAIPVITINAKGLTTSITTAAVVAPAGTLTGTTLANNVVSSSLTSLGTITSLTATTVNATTINAFTLGGTISGGGNQINNIPLLIGGTAVGSTLTLQSTSAVGTTDAIIFKVGNAIEAARFLTSGALQTGGVTSGGTLIQGDLSLSRAAAPTNGALFFGSTNPNYILFDGNKYNFAVNNSTGLTVNATVASMVGSVVSTSPTAGVGYATGAGGTVTQGTNRTTAVTLNKVCGQITMFSAAGSATPATFTVNNTAISTADTVTLSIASGATNVYNLSVTTVTNATSFVITYYTTGGTATDAPVINFTIHKGVTS